MIHEEILTKVQREVVSLVERFMDRYYLVGGTALALQLGHRRSIDFDLFTPNEFDNDRIISLVQSEYSIEKIYINEVNQLMLMVHGVKMTWYRYEYDIKCEVLWNKIKMPKPIMIGAMKAFALGRRAKWKDYVDLYFLLQKYSWGELVHETRMIFGEGLFDEMLLRGQLSYYKDVNYQEEVEYMPGFEVDDNVIKEYLMKVASRE